MQPLQETLEEALCCPSVAAGLHQNVKHDAVLIDGAPEIMLFTVDPNEDFVQVPFVTGPGKDDDSCGDQLSASCEITSSSLNAVTQNLVRRRPLTDEAMTKSRRPPIPDERALSALFQQAAQHLVAGDPAAATLLPALERFPDYAPGWVLIGDVLLRAGRRDAAVMALRRALHGQSGSAGLIHRIGQSFIELRDSATAIVAFRKSLSLDPSFVGAWYSLGLVLQDLRDYAEAAEAYRAALRLHPDFHEAAFNLGIALQESGQMEDAMDAYSEALRMRPESFGRIAQALVSGRTGALWLRPADLRIALTRHVAPSHPA